MLRVGGTVVLLLSQELRKHMDGLTECAGSDSPETTADDTGETAPAKALSADGSSFFVEVGVGESFLSSRQTLFGSLVPRGVYGVSLGKSDAFICKDRKVSAAGSRSLCGTVLKQLES